MDLIFNIYAHMHMSIHITWVHSASVAVRGADGRHTEHHVQIAAHYLNKIVVQAILEQK